uniref:Uncharacterized protein n=1 Tax=Tanacetum cinerariifolium TaxID=118510 RepID=A0A699I678_TANCI|nr:hypothetical protein [Tanacetum cinerariifolium]
MMEWFEMLHEVLDIIAQKYITFYEDYLSFACVCMSWCLAAARTYHNSTGPPSWLPSLIFLVESKDDKKSCELFFLSNKSIRKIRFREAYGKVYTSSCGWLLTVGEDFTTQLLIPLSHEIINLLKINTFPEAIHPLNWEYAISKWTYVEHGLDNYFIYDITFYNGQVFTLGLNNTIQACDVNRNDPTVLVDVADGERKELLV